MTREEAIKTIKANYPSGGYEDLRQALDMAVEALQEQKVGHWEAVYITILFTLYSRQDFVRLSGLTFFQSLL